MTSLALQPRVVPRMPGAFGTRRSAHVVERNMAAYRRMWLLLFTGAFEPIFYLLSLGVGLGKLIPDVAGPDGSPVKYVSFVAPALLATAAMNGAMYDSTFGIFHRLKYGKVYDAILATPLTAPDIALGELVWCLMRGGLYAVAFTVVEPVGRLTPLAVTDDDDVAEYCAPAVVTRRSHVVAGNVHVPFPSAVCT